MSSVISENEILPLDGLIVKPFTPARKGQGKDFFTDRQVPLPLPADESQKAKQDKELGQRIKERRDALRWTQRQLDLKAGLPEGSVKVIEGGQGASDKRIEPIARALGLTVGFLRYNTPTQMDVDALRLAAKAEGRREALAEVQSFLVYLREHGELASALEAMAADETVTIEDGGEIGGEIGGPPPALPPAEYVARPVPRPASQSQKRRNRG